MKYMFIVLGNDKRMEYVAERLYDKGSEVSRELVNNKSNIIMILPPPVNIDYYNKISICLDKIKIIYGGAISEEFKIKVGTHTQIIDYLECPEIISENAILTAQGIIKEALEQGAKLNDSNILVTGYGYCGKAISKELNNLGCNVFVAVRNNNLKDIILWNGYKYVDLNKINSYPLKDIDYIFNTIPAKIINVDLIDSLNNSVMIFDIASKPGGVDFDYCKSKGISAFLSLGIPGKLYPRDAGYLIADFCYNNYIIS